MARRAPGRLVSFARIVRYNSSIISFVALTEGDTLKIGSVKEREREEERTGWFSLLLLVQANVRDQMAARGESGN